MRTDDTQILGGPKPFPKTSWTMIRGASNRANPTYRASLDTLIRRYWSPVNFYIRRNWGRGVEEAKDLTQAFFLDLLERESFHSVGADKGKFRNFVCAALFHFLTKQARYAGAKIRNPEEGVVSLEGIEGNESHGNSVAARESEIEQHLKEEWKRAVVNAALDRLRQRAKMLEKSLQVNLLVRYDLDPNLEGRPTYADLASEFGISIHDVTNSLHWARTAFKQACIEEIRDQVSTDEDLKEEIRNLFGGFAAAPSE